MLKSAKFLMAGIALAAMAGHAQAQEKFTLRFHSFMHAQSYQQVKFFEPWCARIKEQSKGRLECQIFPSMQLGGAPGEILQQAKDGIIDIGYQNPGYAPGKYLKTEVFEMPFLISDPHAAAKAMYEYVTTEAKDELAGLKVIAACPADYTLIMTTSKPVKTLEDMKGLKIRSSGRYAGKINEALGALPVQMPGGQITESLVRGVIDGALLPWSGVRLLKLGEVLKHYTDFAEGQRTLSNSPQLVVMGEGSYNKLPADLKKVIDDNSGLEVSVEFADAFDSTKKEDKKIVMDGGGDVYFLPDNEYKRWVEAVSGIEGEWVKEANARGYDGEALLKKAKDLIAKHSK
ncbi:MAG: TRAP transporter substrate-binding protein [Flavobacteriaceae bacterium]